MGSTDRVCEVMQTWQLKAMTFAYRLPIDDRFDEHLYRSNPGTKTCEKNGALVRKHDQAIGADPVICQHFRFRSILTCDVRFRSNILFVLPEN